MKIHILSDLHLEFAPFQSRETEADVVILAGDISTGSRGVKWAMKHFSQPVIYVPGNHEFYNPEWTMDELFCEMRYEAENTNVHVLDRETVEIDGVHFLGTTLWTDLHDQPFGGVESGLLGSDVDHIRVAGGECLSSSVAQSLFEKNRAWLKAQLQQPFHGKTVVITHHAPSDKSLHRQYAGNPWNSCFVTDLESLMGDSVDLWVHGHTHNNFDYEVGNTRVVCNPRGYPHPFGGWENRAFTSDWVISLDAEKENASLNSLDIPIREKDGTTYVRISDLPKEQRESLREFMRGGQIPVIKGEVSFGAVYSWDYERWKSGSHLWL